MSKQIFLPQRDILVPIAFRAQVASVTVTVLAAPPQGHQGHDSGLVGSDLTRPPELLVKPLHEGGCRIAGRAQTVHPAEKGPVIL